MLQLLQRAASAGDSRTWSMPQSQPRWNAREAIVPPGELLLRLLEEPESVLESQLEQRPESGTLGLGEVDLPSQRFGSCTSRASGAMVEVAEHGHVACHFLFQPGRQGGVPRSLYAYFSEPGSCPFGAYRPDHSGMSPIVAGDDAFEIVREIGDAAQLGRKRRAGKDRDAVVRLLPAIGDAIPAASISASG